MEYLKSLLLISFLIGGVSLYLEFTEELKCRQLAISKITQLALLQTLDQIPLHVSTPLKLSVKCHFIIRKVDKGYQVLGAANLKGMKVNFESKI